MPFESPYQLPPVNNTVYYDRFPNLVATNIVWQLNRAKAELRISGIIQNRSTAANYKPFKTSVGVSFRRAGVSLTYERLTEQSTLASHGSWQTPPTVVPLVFFDEDPGAIYTAQVYVDVYGDVFETSETDNSLTRVNKFFSSALLESKESVTLEFKIES